MDLSGPHESGRYPDLRERMARVEGLIEGFTKRETKTITLASGLVNWSAFLPRASKLAHHYASPPLA